MKYSAAKIFSVCALAVMTLVLFAVSGSAALVGDVVDNDGDVTANDARHILRASVYLEVLTEEQMLLADVDNDGLINASDARSVLRMSVNLEAKEHFFNKEVTKEPDCTQTGICTWTCTECDEPAKEINIPALGHDFGEPEILIQVTCEVAGTERYTCARCGFSEDRTVEAGHTPDRPAATCTEDQLCTRGNHIMAEKTGHDTDWGKCGRCKIFITDKYPEQAQLIKEKFAEAKAAFDYAYSINSYNSMLDGVSWKVLPNTEKAKSYYLTAKTAFESALAACGDAAEFAEIKVLLTKNIENLSGVLAQTDIILATRYVDTRNFEELVWPLEKLNSLNSDSILKTNNKLSRLIVW